MPTSKIDIIKKIERADLTGRGGAGFPTAVKWKMVKSEKAEKKYVVANGSEGEPGVMKDSYILENWPDKLIKGLRIAMRAVGAKEGYVYLRSDLYSKYKKKLERLIGKTSIKVFREDGKYLCGEETVLINSIQEKRNEPSFKPPYPTQKGLWGFPTLINNIETLYTVSLIAEGKYDGKRFYSLSGIVKKTGVYRLDVDLPLEEILTQSGNLPKVDYFAMTGGGACGHVVASRKAKDYIVKGAAAVIIFSVKHDPERIMRRWTEFFLKRSCGKCVPCREGFYRIDEIFDNPPIDYKLLREILETMAMASFCGLGQYAPISYLTLIDEVIKP